MTPMFRRWQPEEAEVAASFLAGDELAVGVLSRR